MEILLLLLFGGLTAGIGLWAALGDKKKAESSNLPPGAGPLSSPSLPLAGEDGQQELDNMGKPVVIGDSSLAHKDQLRGILEKGPEQVAGKIVSPPYDPKKQKKPGHGRPLKVTYSTDEIVSRSSRYSHHRRALGTAESLVDHEKAEEAINVYERTKNRIPENEAREKIDKNIDDINKWLSNTDIEEDGLQFPEIIIPLTTQAIALENLNEALKTISENLLDRINEVVNRIPGPAQSAPGPASIIPLPQVAGQMNDGAVSTAYTAPGVPSIPVSYPSFGEVLALKIAKPVAAGPQNQESLPPGFQLDKNGNLITDGWTDEDFDKEWEKYKDLPLKDRRSGKDRRLGIDRRRVNDPARRDRRSGIERRKEDLFQERDDFLKKLEEHKDRKRELEEWRKDNEIPEPLLPVVAMEEEPLVAEQPELLEPGVDELDPDELEPEPEDEEVSKVESRTEIIAPDLDPIGMPGADEPYIEPVTVATTASEPEPELPEPKPEEGVPSTPVLGDGVEDVGDIPELGFSEPLDEEAEPSDKEAPAPQEIHGVLELKPPEEDDAPFLTLTYDFTKIPDSFKLSADYHTMEFAYYKYKPMLIKAQEFTRRKMLKNALNYYRVIKSQNIPSEFKRMVNRNIKDITEYLEKFLMSRG